MKKKIISLLLATSLVSSLYISQIHAKKKPPISKTKKVADTAIYTFLGTSFTLGAIGSAVASLGFFFEAILQVMGEGSIPHDPQIRKFAQENKGFIVTANLGMSALCAGKALISSYVSKLMFKKAYKTMQKKSK